MQTLRRHPRPMESETLGVGPDNLCACSPPGDSGALWSSRSSRTSEELLHRQYAPGAWQAGRTPVFLLPYPQHQVLGAKTHLLDTLWVQLGSPKKEYWTETQNRMLALRSGEKGIWEFSMLRGKRRKKYVPRFLTLPFPWLIVHRRIA